MSEAWVEVWNRGQAYPPHPDEGLGVGDRALRDLSKAHNMVMNGGIGHCVEMLSREEMVSAEAGYRWFGLDEAADALALAGPWAEAGGEDEALEGQIDTALNAADNELLDRFKARFDDSPADFASTQRGETG